MAAANNLGLALSGGGYRASVFHLGTLNKLNELGILKTVDVISTISGGSITGAAWCLTKDEYPKFHADMVRTFNTKDVIKRIIFSWTFFFAILVFLGLLVFSIWLTTTQYACWAYPVLLLFLLVFFFFQFKIFPVSKVIERAYNVFFYKKKTLADLDTKHKLAIGSSNLHTGRPFTFSRDKMADSAYSNWMVDEVTLIKNEKGELLRTEQGKKKIAIEFLPEKFPIARAVAASSCVPFAFTPIAIDKSFFKDPSQAKRVTPVLVDGGVYDNQGIQKITQHKSSYECKVIIVSDAGGSFVGKHKYRNVISLLGRTVNLFMYRIKASSMVQNIYLNTEEQGRPIAYFSLGWDLKECIPGFVSAMCNGQILKHVLDDHQFEPAWLERPASYIKEVTARLEANVNYNLIMSRNVPEPFLTKVKATGTSLKCLSKERIDALIRHAENLTELQVRLYCPFLIKE